jgi:hypothetical protein
MHLSLHLDSGFAPSARPGMTESFIRIWYHPVLRRTVPIVMPILRPRRHAYCGPARRYSIGLASALTKHLPTSAGAARPPAPRLTRSQG